MPTQVSGLRELAKHVLETSPGDSLGLRYDLEAQLLLIEGIVEQFSQSLAPEHLKQWRRLIDGVQRDFELRAHPLELGARFHTHRLMLDTVEKLMEMRNPELRSGAMRPGDPSIKVEDQQDQY